LTPKLLTPNVDLPALAAAESAAVAVAIVGLLAVGCAFEEAAVVGFGALPVGFEPLGLIAVVAVVAVAVAVVPMEVLLEEEAAVAEGEDFGFAAGVLSAVAAACRSRRTCSTQLMMGLAATAVSAAIPSGFATVFADEDDDDDEELGVVIDEIEAAVATVAAVA
jgi:hypothetical protein